MINYLSYFNLDLDKALEPEEIIFKKCTTREKIRRLAALLALLAALKVKDRGEKNKDSKYLFIKSMRRPDYDNLFYTITECCVDTKSTYDFAEDAGHLKISSIIQILKCLPFSFKLYRKNIITWAFLYLSFVKTTLKIKKITANKNSHVIVFADMQPLDNLIAQHANKIGLTTTTLQHGLFVDYDKLKNVNIVNYTNTPSNNFLSWGENTTSLIRRKHPHKNVVICGKPTLTAINVTAKKDYFTVILDQNMFLKFNLELIEIAYSISKKLNLNVNLRLHPNNKIEWLKIKPEVTIINKDINLSKFVIGHTSSLIYECMRQDIPTFRYQTNIPAINLPHHLQFTSSYELNQAACNIDTNFSEVAKEFISFMGEDSKKKYTNFFKSLSHSTDT